MRLVLRRFSVVEEKSKISRMVSYFLITLCHHHDPQGWEFVSVKLALAGIEGSDLGACEWVELRKMEDSEDGVPTYCSNDMRPSPKRTRDCKYTLGFKFNRVSS